MFRNWNTAECLLRAQEALDAYVLTHNVYWLESFRDWTLLAIMWMPDSYAYCVGEGTIA